MHARHTFTPAHFGRWLELFEETLDSGWAGPNVEHARAFAHRVATVHARQLLDQPAEHDGEPGGAAVPVMIGASGR